jgi:hypothetical protein
VPSPWTTGSRQASAQTRTGESRGGEQRGRDGATRPHDQASEEEPRLREVTGQGDAHPPGPGGQRVGRHRPRQTPDSSPGPGSPPHLRQESGGG